MLVLEYPSKWLRVYLGPSVEFLRDLELMRKVCWYGLQCLLWFFWNNCDIWFVGKLHQGGLYFCMQSIFHPNRLKNTWKVFFTFVNEMCSGKAFGCIRNQWNLRLSGNIGVIVHWFPMHHTKCFDLWPPLFPFSQLSRVYVYVLSIPEIQIKYLWMWLYVSNGGRTS